MMKRHYPFVVFFLIPFYMQSQQISSISSFYENAAIWNPAATAKSDSSELILTHKEEWTGFDKAPGTTTISYQFPFLSESTRVNLGVALELDRVGPYRAQGAKLMYAYKLTKSENHNFRIGLSTSVRGYNYNDNGLVTFDNENIPTSNVELQNFRFNSDVGVYYSSSVSRNNEWYLGLSANNIIPAKVFEDLNNINLKPHFTLHSGLRIYSKQKEEKEKSLNYFIEPNLFLNYTLSEPFLAMLSLRFELIDKLWLAAGYATNEDVFAQVGVVVNKNSKGKFLFNGNTLRVGGKVDFATGAISDFSGVGYELFISYVF